MTSGPPHASRVESRATARFPDVPLEQGHYESFYLKAGHPTGRRAVWIRYTVHKRPGRPPTGSLWFTLFGARPGETGSSGPLASKVTLPADRLGAGAGDYIRIGDSAFSPGRVAGEAASDRLDAAWELEFEVGDQPLRHLPRSWMYRAPIPRTKLESPHPGATFRGRVRAGDEEVDVDGWPGVVGHNWGREHAERWIWMHGAAFEGHGRSTWLDGALGRIRVGPATTPWVANGMLSLDGVRHRLGGLGAVRGTRVSETPQGCDFVLPGQGLAVRGRVESPERDLVGWLYADPDGPEHHTANCSIASMRLEVSRPGEAPLELVSRSGATYELGMRERDHGVPIQPFPDG